MTDNDKIYKALEIAVQYGDIEGENRKTWVIDQMVRALTGCPVVKATAYDCWGKPYTFDTQGESDEYKVFIREHNEGENGLDTYEWNTGTAP
jgi:hypothetical protein